MNTIETKLNILIDGLRKKEQSLLEIVNITENQGTVLESELPQEQIQTFVANMNMEKQAHIQDVIKCDNLFEKILNEIGKALDKSPESYVEQVQTIQEGIKKVMDLDVKVRVLEEKNNRFVLSRREAEKLLARQKRPKLARDTSRLIDAYKKNTRD